jgi:hypothetical protein
MTTFFFYKTEMLPTQNICSGIPDKIKILLPLKVHLCILFDTR